MTTPADGRGGARDPAQEPSRRNGWLALAGTILGLLLQATGAVFSGLYASAAASVLDAADRSVVFWYSGFLLFGIFLTATGLALLLMLTSELRDPVAWAPRRVVRGLMWFLAGAGGIASAAGVALAVWHLYGV